MKLAKICYIIKDYFFLDKILKNWRGGGSAPKLKEANPPVPPSTTSTTRLNFSSRMSTKYFDYCNKCLKLFN
jgi:hypothetical protein